MTMQCIPKRGSHVGPVGAPRPVDLRIKPIPAMYVRGGVDCGSALNKTFVRGSMLALRNVAFHTCLA